MLLHKIYTNLRHNQRTFLRACFSVMMIVASLGLGELLLKCIGYSYCPLRIEKLGAQVQGLTSDWRL